MTLNTRSTRYFFWLLAGFFGACQALHSRFDVVNDTISYLDMGEAYLRGDWTAALNGQWGPFFAWLWAGTQFLLHPSPAWEYPVLHLLMFVIFLATIMCFDSLLGELILLKKNAAAVDQDTAIPDFVWSGIGYSIFLWATLGEITVAETNPDMLVAASVFMAAALVLKIRRGRDSWVNYVALGAVLSFGYLTKAVLFPLAFLFLFGVIRSLADFRQKIPKLGLSLLVFMLLAGPLIVALSSSRGHLTFGETGRFNYAVHVNGIAARHWQGEEPGSGTPRHPTRRIFEHPAAFEFATPLIGTYPFWYDPSYWYEGVKAHFRFSDQAHALARGFSTVIARIFGLNGSLLTLACLWLFLSDGGWRSLVKLWPLILPAVVGIILYATVHVEPRYIASFLALLFPCLIFGANLPQSVMTRRFAVGSSAVLLAMVLCPWGPTTLSKDTSVLQELRPSRRQPNTYYAAAKAMHDLGIRTGDAVASTNYANMENVKYCRLARVRVIAEVYYRSDDPTTFSDNFWSATPAIQEKLLNTFAAVGAKAVLSDEPPCGPGSSGWQRLGTTNFFIYLFAR